MRRLLFACLAFATILPAAELEFSSFFGGNMREYGRAVTLDEAGNIYVVGDTSSNDLALVNPIQGTGEMYLLRLDPTGSQVLQATYLGGDNDLPIDLVVNNEGCVYIAGIAGAGFTATEGAFQTERRGTDAFILKINAEGTAIEAATRFGGRLSEDIVGIELDSGGAVHVVGNTSSDDLPTTPGAYQEARGTPDNTTGVFIAKFSADLSELIYSTHIDSEDDEQAFDIDVHEFSAYIVGNAETDGFPTTAGVVQAIKNGAPRDGFVLKLSPDGSSLVFSTFVGGDNLDIPKAIDVDQLGYPHVVGDTNGFNFPTTGAPSSRRTLTTRTSAASPSSSTVTLRRTCTRPT